MASSASFNVNEHLERRRAEQYSQCFDLLWENIQNGQWTRLERFGGRELSDAEKIQKQVDHRFHILAQFFMLVGHSVGLISDTSVRSILQFGASRRIGSMRVAVGRILDIAPPHRIERLSTEERSDATDAMLVFYVHLIGVLDAFSIALARSQRPDIPEKKADLLSKRFRKELSISGLDQLFIENDLWLTRIKEEMRNRFVHRIPPYIPDARFTQEESDTFNKLEADKFRLIAEGKIEESDRAEAEQSRIGRFWPVIAFTDTEAVVSLHPTLLDDAYRFCCLVYKLLDLLMPIFIVDKSGN